MELLKPMKNNKKRKLHQSSHPLSSYPFEAFLFDSWKAVELIKIEAGTLTIRFINNYDMILEKGPASDFRIRSRKATLSDCSSFLRTGIDVCVLSASQQADNSEEVSLEPAWVDARISSIQRKPHESECLCEYFVNFYVNQGSANPEIRTLNKEVKVVGINHISILQKLERNPCENQHYRWESSEDCFAIPETKLLAGKFLSDLSWLVVASVIKQVSFCVRSVQNKILYQLLGDDNSISLLNTGSCRHVVNFRVDNNGMLVPIVSQVVLSDSNRVDKAHDSHEDEVSPITNLEGLRRSKRRIIQPDRYLDCDGVPKSKGAHVRTRPYEQGNSPEEDIDSSQNVNEINTTAKTWEVKSSDANKEGQETQLKTDALPDEGDPIDLDHYHLNAKTTENPAHETHDLSKYDELIHIPKKREIVNLWKSEPYDHSPKIPVLENSVKEIADKSSRWYYQSGACNVQRKDSSGLEDMDFISRWAGIRFNEGTRGKRHRSTITRSKNIEEGKASKDRTLSAAEYKELINLYFKNIDTSPTKAEPPITDQWDQFEATGNSQTDANEEVSEIDMLWREMELALASNYVLDDTEGSKAAVFAETLENSNRPCQHDFRLNEEIGLYCRKCGFVSTEMKDISPPFIQTQYLGWHREETQRSPEYSEAKADIDDDDDDDDLHRFLTHASPDKPISEERDNIWGLIPELTRKLHVHQKKAFEFLWKNIAGSVEPALMKAESKRNGGCVISHAPGAGKTFLIIAFLVSYLKLFPSKRPLILAPKTTLYTWYKEFIKWEIPIPVYMIQGRTTFSVRKEKSMVFPGARQPAEDVKHVLDCLEKIQKWHAHPSVLIMGYTSFFTLMREDSKYSHRKHMAKVLRKSPGILVLDEGHNPRSTKSSLRKALMKVETDMRILLSGTLFQNNFCEYFNTLCLARPKFAHEVLKKLDPKYKRKKGATKAWNLIESRARKFFLDKIAKKIDSDISDERMQGLNMLRNITNGFIDVYEGGGSENLPGLHVYTLLMNMTDCQDEIFQTLHKRMREFSGYPLEIELLITLASIHPWLIKTAACADRFLSVSQLRELEKTKFDLKIGPKVRFVLSLVYRVVKEEKILIFCHNIAPVRLFVELFEKFFGWQRGREVLVLSGELELFERGRVMDKFEDVGGASKVLLASITACAEGICLTAASRVIMLDSEWNPSKTKQAIARAFRPGQQKVVYVYQLLVTGTLEEDKYQRTTWKEWVSSMIFSEAFVEDPSQWQADKIEDETLRDMIEEDRSKIFHMIIKNEKASTN